MTQPNTDAERRKRPTGPVHHLYAARLLLLWERSWRVLWAPVSIVGAFVAVALFGLPQAMPGWLHLAFLAAVALGVLSAGWIGARGFQWPTTAEARRRLESDSGLQHRPLHALDDRAAGDDPMAEALWRLHQERIRNSIGNLRLRLPHADIVARDPCALRVLVALVLLVAAIGSWGEWTSRLAAALAPRFAAVADAPPPSLDLWLTPPEYTGLPPQFLQTASSPAVPKVSKDVVIQVPKGSTVMARVNGGRDVPVLQVNGGRKPFDSVETGIYQIRQRVDEGPELAVVQRGHVLARWAVELTPDHPPNVVFAENPEAGPNGVLRVVYSADDDYGLSSLALRVRLDDAQAQGGRSAQAEPFELPVTLSGNRPRQVNATVFQDLTPHPWAGLPVRLQLVAVDGAGQKGFSDELAIVLPERTFRHPVAQAVIGVRKDLVTFGGKVTEEAASRLVELNAKPDAFRGDVVAVLALRAAAARLVFDRSEEAVPAVVELLWDTALRIEDGLLSIAERDLREAQKRLSEALDREAGEEELARLMDDLQKAIDRYLEAMEAQIQQALQRGEKVMEMPEELANRMGMVDSGDLQSMLDRMRALAETGSRDAARQMLSQLQQMLENMRTATLTQAQQGQQNQVWNLMRDMQDMIGRQQQLLDEAFQISQGTDASRGRDSQAAQRQLSSQADRQESLRRDLGDLMRRLGTMSIDPPGSLGRADRAMRNAAQSLRRGQAGVAASRENQAVDELQQGLQSFADQIMQQMTNLGMMPSGSALGLGRGRDPLGRQAPGNGFLDTNEVRIPEEADLQRAREILDELRRRSSEYSRPRLERDYIDRLLRQF